MGLAASQARLLLLTAKNDALELQAQKIENERLILAQEQETIAQEYTDKTSNTISTCRVTNPDGTTTQETMTLTSLAKANQGKAIVIANADGEPIIKAKADWGEAKDSKDAASAEWETQYSVMIGDEFVDVDFNKNLEEQARALIDGNPKAGEEGHNPGLANMSVSKVTSLLKYFKNTKEQFDKNGSGTVLQNGIANGGYQVWVQDTSETANPDSTSLTAGEVKDVGGTKVLNDGYYVRKTPESMNSVTSRYYTEDDAAAQAAYDTAMAKVNALDTRLENKLNQVETQKKAVEQEMESVDSIIQSNIERTFQYFS